MGRQQSYWLSHNVTMKKEILALAHELCIRCAKGKARNMTWQSQKTELTCQKGLTFHGWQKLKRRAGVCDVKLLELLPGNSLDDLQP
jgi:hypothetical protein